MSLYKPTWNSLRRHHTPEWFHNAKFGIYTHWGVYSVPACGPNVTWYPYFMYREGNAQYDHHVKTYGGAEKFGYKDFIPMLTGTRFDADEWAELFSKAGARFAGPVGEHHDGFCFWDTQYGEWKSTLMGPKRDIVGELECAYRKQNMKFLVALHHAENWWFFPHWRKEFDTSDPRYVGLYGELHNVDTPPKSNSFSDQDLPSRAFLKLWLDKTLEAIDKYQPDILWFDGGLGAMDERRKLEMLAYYYNKASEWGREVVVNYKGSCLPPNIAVLDHELGRERALSLHEWITDTTVDDGAGWGYLADATYKTATSLVHYLIDNVSKNGYMLLNVGPRPDGSIPEEAKALLLEIGQWLEVNGEAIYDTTSWYTYGEGPTGSDGVGVSQEGEKWRYNAQDIRFTVKDDALYATCLGWPGDSLTITTLKGSHLYAHEEVSVTLLGSDHPLTWQKTEKGLVINMPPKRPCEHAYVFKIVRRSA